VTTTVLTAFAVACCALVAHAQTAPTDTSAVATTDSTTAPVAPPTTPAVPQIPSDVSAVQLRWAQIKYELPEDQRVAAFEKLVAQADAAVKANPGSTEAVIWQGICLSTWAGERGGMGALGIAKRARNALEAAVKRDRRALNGSALTSLGSLYHGVPGWPIGFGDDDKAEELLQQGLAINPDGIDSNFFYGQYLYDEDRYDEALRAFKRAQAAAPRPGREIADAGRRAELVVAIARTQAELED
jgi:tetratricopeptide (TPR) repeat protein